jgi:hypothetical protein
MRTWLGVHVGNEPVQVAEFDAWLGGKADVIHAFTGGKTWAEIADPGWAVAMWAPLDKPVVWSVPLIPTDGTTLRQAATGAFDWAWASAAKHLAASGAEAPDGYIYVRTGWEVLGTHAPWSKESDPAVFTESYRRFVEAFRSVDPDFKFVWDYHGNTADPRPYYPGDAWVDVVSIDFYWTKKWTRNDPKEAFAFLRDMPWGLRFAEQFAAERGKQTAYTEWGVGEGGKDDAAPFVAEVARWVEEQKPLFHAVWDLDSNYDGRLSDGGDPQTGAAFKAAFGGGEAPAQEPVPAPDPPPPLLALPTEPVPVPLAPTPPVPPEPQPPPVPPPVSEPVPQPVPPPPAPDGGKDEGDGGAERPDIPPRLPDIDIPDPPRRPDPPDDPGGARAPARDLPAAPDIRAPDVRVPDIDIPDIDVPALDLSVPRTPDIDPFG